METTARTVDERAVAVPEEVRVLTRMRELLAGGFCQWSLARDEKGRRVQPECAEATEYCVLGAEMRVRRELGLPNLGWRIHDGMPAIESQVAHLLVEEPEEEGSETQELVFWNNAPGRTQEEVLRKVDRALSRYRK